MSNIESLNVKNEILLENYNKLIVNYEKTHQLSQSVILEYNSSIVSETITTCSQLIAYTSETRVIKWGVVLLNDFLIYESDANSKFDTWHIQLKDLNLQPGTLFRLRANLVANSNYFSDQILQYEPDVSTLYYRFDAIDNEPYLGPKLLCNVPSYTSPPILQCSKITGDNNAKAIIKWVIITVENNKTIYVSSRQRNLESPWSKSLLDLNLLPGTLLRLKASVSGGSDSEPYIILQYEPTSRKNASFTIIGTIFKTLTMFNG